MRVRLAGLTSLVLAGLLVHCSLLVDTDGLTGGPAEAGTSTDSGGAAIETGAADAAADVVLSPGALGPLWLAYGSTAGALGVRRWDEAKAQWSPELPGPAPAGAVRWVVAKETPIGSFLGVVRQIDSAAELDVFERAPDGSWTLGFTQPMPSSNVRAFDLEYETKANGVMAVYSDATPNVKYRHFTAAGGWTAQGSLEKQGAAPALWVELARSPISDEIALTYVDDGVNIYTAFWDGATWGAPVFHDGDVNVLDWKCFDAAYENASGNLLVAWGHQVPGSSPVRDMRYRVRAPGGQFTDEKSVAPGTAPGSLVMTPMIGSNRIAISFVEYLCNAQQKPCDDFAGAIWDGQSMVSHPIDPDTTTLYGDRPGAALTSVAWLGTSGVAIAAYHRDLSDPSSLAYSRFSGSWSAPAPAVAPPALAPRVSMQLASAPGAKVVAVIEDATGQLYSKVYSEAAGGARTWTDAAGGDRLTSALVTTGGVPFSVTLP